MTRIGAAVLVVAGVALLSACQGAPVGEQTPSAVPTASPTWVDLSAAAQIGGDGNGLWLLEPNQAAQRVIAAVRAGGSVRTEVAVTETPVDENDAPLPGRTLQATREGTADAYLATVRLGDRAGEVVVVGGDAWARGNAAFAAHYGLEGLEDEESVICVGVRSPVVDDVAALSEPATVLRTALIGMEIGILPPEKDARTLEMIVGSGGAPVGTVEVDAFGPPLPHRLVTADETGTVSITFQWDAEASAAGVRPPDGAPACR